MVHNPGSRRQLLTFLAAASFSCFGPMSIARDIANGTFTPQSTVGDVLDEPLFEPFARYLLPLETVSRYRDLSETDRQMPLSLAFCRPTPTSRFRLPAAFSTGSRSAPRRTIAFGYRFFTRTRDFSFIRY